LKVITIVQPTAFQRSNV